MSDNIKLVIEIPKEAKQAFDEAISNDLKGCYYDHGGVIGKAIQNGIPLDDVKAEIEKKCDRINSIASVLSYSQHREIQELLCEILASIGKADMSGKSCSTCKNNDDEFSGECYECLKGIFDHYEAESEGVKNDNPEDISCDHYDRSGGDDCCGNCEDHKRQSKEQKQQA